MNKIFKTIGLASLICFSFFYTEKVITVINEQDAIMIKINEVKDNYKQDPINATIENNTIIPGIFGREVDVEESYNRIKKIGIFNSSLLVYDDITPAVSISNNYDKYIIKGNSNNKKVALLFILDNTNSNNLNTLLDVINNKKIDISIFIDYTYLNNNINTINNLKKYELYSYNNYTTDKFLFANNIIKRITKEDTLYCLAKEENKDILKICSKNKISTIIPTIIGDSSAYNNITSSLSNGSIILLNIDTKTINELNSIIDFINGKGLEIVFLSKLLDEKIN